MLLNYLLRKNESVYVAQLLCLMFNALLKIVKNDPRLLRFSETLRSSWKILIEDPVMKSKSRLLIPAFSGYHCKIVALEMVGFTYKTLYLNYFMPASQRERYRRFLS